MPDEWLMTNVSTDSSSPASSSGTRSAIDLFFGLRLSRTPTSPNWNEPSTRTTFLTEARRPRRPPVLTAMVVRPDPALRAEDGDDETRLSFAVAVARAPVGPDHGDERGHPAELVALAARRPGGSRQ